MFQALVERGHKVMVAALLNDPRAYTHDVFPGLYDTCDTRDCCVVIFDRVVPPGAPAVTLSVRQIGKCRRWAWWRVRGINGSDGFPSTSTELGLPCGVCLVSVSLVPGLWRLCIRFRWCRCRISRCPRRICTPDYQSPARLAADDGAGGCFPSAGRPLRPPPSLLFPHQEQTSAKRN